MARTRPTPFEQGEFDGLCALYSVINGIRLAFASQRPLSYAHCQTLFFEGIAFIEAKGRLASTITEGTNFIFWFSLQGHLCKVASDLSGQTITIERPFKTSKFVRLEQLKAKVLECSSQGLPCLAALAGRYKHYTVIQGATPTRIHLFDSYGYRWVNWANVRTSSKTGAQAHVFRPSSLCALRLLD